MARWNSCVVRRYDRPKIALWSQVAARRSNDFCCSAITLSTQDGRPALQMFELEGSYSNVRPGSRLLHGTKGGGSSARADAAPSSMEHPARKVAAAAGIVFMRRTTGRYECCANSPNLRRLGFARADAPGFGV